MKHNISKLIQDNAYATLKLEAKLIEPSQGYLIIRIHRPESLNALNSQVLADLNDLITKISEVSVADLVQQKVQALVITGSGEKSFVAGADIKEMTGFAEAHDEQKGSQFSFRGQSIFRRLETLKIPVVAAVNGFCLGGGLELALSCDFIYASEKAKLGLPEVSLGLIPGFGGTVRLARVVGVNQAREMILSGQMLSAAEAMQIGLVNKVFPAEALYDKVHETVVSIISKGPSAVATAKKSIMTTYDQDIEEGLQTEASHFGDLFKLNDTKEGLSAFIEKRKANFTGH